MGINIRKIASIDSAITPYAAPSLQRVNRDAAQKFQKIFEENTPERPKTIRNPGKVSRSLWQSWTRLAENANQNPFLKLPAKQLVVDVLNERFGSRLIKDVLKRYHLDEKPTLTLSDFRAILVGVAASVSEKDLQWLFKRYKQQGLLKQDTFKDLPDDGIEMLVGHFRASITNVEAWKNNCVTCNTLHYQHAFNRDIGFLKVCSVANDFKFHDQEVAISEYLAHEVAYSEMLKGRVIPIRTNDGSLTFEKVSQYICKSGYVCGILTPLQTHQHLEDFKVRVLYRGTHDKLSASRLGEPHSAGHFSFVEHQHRLINSIAAAIPKNAEKSCVQFCGHSLGGADSSRGIASLAFIIACVESKTRTFRSQTENIKLGLRSFKHVKLNKELDLDRIEASIKKIRRVEARIWNSPGTAHKTNNSFKHWVSLINDVTPTSRRLNGEDSEWISVDAPKRNNRKRPKVIFKISVGKVHGDPIQQAGQITLGHGLGFHTPALEREVYEFDHGFGGLRGCLCYLGRGGIKAHQVKNLNAALNNGEVPNYKYLNSQNKKDLDAIEKSTGDHIFAMKFFLWWEKLKWFVITLLFGNPLHQQVDED